METNLNTIAQQIDYKGNISKPELIGFLTSKCEEISYKIQNFERKYNHNLQFVQTNFHQLTDFSVIEKEDDELKWEAYIDFHNEYSKLLKGMSL